MEINKNWKKIENTADKTMKHLVETIIKLEFKEIKQYSFPLDKPFGLQIKYGEQLFCFIIKFSSKNNNLICFGPGAHERNINKPPYFDRWSWFSHFEESTLAYADPMFFLDDKLRIGWFTGGKKWDLKILSEIIQELSRNQRILNDNILFYGSSGGGYVSIALGTLIKNSKVLVNNPQIFLMNFDKKTLKTLFNLLEKELKCKRQNIVENLQYRFNLIELFKKEQYSPSITYYLNILSENDITEHASPFINQLIKLNYFNGINFCLYKQSKKIPHEPLPTNVTINIIKHYNDLLLNNNLYNKNLKLDIKGLENEINFYKLHDKISFSSEDKDVELLCNKLNLVNNELKLFKELNNQYSKYNTARIDIKNEGNPGNHIELIENSDKNSLISFPEWFNKNGKGLIITSEKQNLTLKIKCVGNGELKIWLRGIDFKDKNKNRLPIYINYTHMSINNQNILKTSKTVCHDAPFKIIRTVTNNDILILKLSWTSI